MLKIRLKYTLRECLLIIIFYLFVLQHMLGMQGTVLKFVDEFAAIIGLFYVCRQIFLRRKLYFLKRDVLIFFCILVFITVGLVANIQYKYQFLGPVLKDLFTCLKFFFCIVAGYHLFRDYELKDGNCVILSHTKGMIALLFVMLLFDQIFHIFPSPGVRYGLRETQLIFSHPTYLAGISVFLLGVLTICYEEKNNIFIFCGLMLLCFTLRSKAIAATAVYIAVFFFILQRKKKLKLAHAIIVGSLILFAAWDQIIYYYVTLSDEAARAVLTRTSLQILKDYFPIGTGFGTFASNAAVESYSPVYYKYGINNVYGLTVDNPMFASDTFWPIIIGQTGLLGTIAYVAAITALVFKILKIRSQSNEAYAAGIFLFAYLIISSTSESAFCNAISAPLAILIGSIFTLEKRKSRVQRSRIYDR